MLLFFTIFILGTLTGSIIQSIIFRRTIEELSVTKTKDEWWKRGDSPFDYLEEDDDDSDNVN